MRSEGAGASYESVLIEHGVPASEIFPFVRDNLMTRKMTYAEMAKALFNHFAIRPTSNDLAKVTELWATDNKKAALIPGALETIRALRKQGRIVVLVTNSTAPGWNAVSHLRREFDYVYVSSDQGYAKPDTRVWEMIESWFPAVVREEFAMVGDQEIDDLAIPRQRGWGAISANEIGTLVSKCGPKPTTLIMDTEHRLDEGQLRVFGLDPLRTDVLSNTLASWKGWQTLDPKTTILVVPGNGGSIIARDLLHRLPTTWSSRTLSINAKRVWVPGGSPWATTSLIFPGRMVLGLHDIVLIDDVVASGSTARKIYDSNRPWIPGARWHVLTWLAQRSTSLPGEMNLVAATQCGNFLKREPIASSSTLTSDPEILKSFAERNQAPELVKIFSCLG